MRISNSYESSDITLTKCTKMTEEGHRVHGMNGTNRSGIAAAKDEYYKGFHTDNVGGRLKFFKNGKFILELERAREGEKIAWVPVQKKTFWPPQGNASSVTTYRQESSTSLSVSDDNSSVQSSPWQRDHTWKQTMPVRNASNNECFYLKKNKKQRRKHSCWTVFLLRKPYTTSSADNIKCNRCVKSAIVNVKNHLNLTSVVEMLKNKNRPSVSPRKRILRELERVSIEDVSLKRCRGKVAEVNGGSSEADGPVAPKNCNYSIMSLLGGKCENRQDRLSSQHEQQTPPVMCASSASRAAHFVNHAGKKSSTSSAWGDLVHQPYIPPYTYPAHVSSSYYSSYHRGGYLPVQPDVLPYPWITSYDQLVREDAVSDVPLNLSKHAD